MPPQKPLVTYPTVFGFAPYERGRLNVENAQETLIGGLLGCLISIRRSEVGGQAIRLEARWELLEER